MQEVLMPGCLRKCPPLEVIKNSVRCLFTVRRTNVRIWASKQLFRLWQRNICVQLILLSSFREDRQENTRAFSKNNRTLVYLHNRGHHEESQKQGHFVIEAGFHCSHALLLRDIGFWVVLTRLLVTLATGVTCTAYTDLNYTRISRFVITWHARS